LTIAGTAWMQTVRSRFRPRFVIPLRRVVSLDCFVEVATDGVLGR
jgi:hypothetical protein